MIVLELLTRKGPPLTHTFIAIFILSNMADNVPEASDDSKVGFLDHVNLVQSCLNAITYLNHVSVEFSRKRKSNLQ